MISRRPVDDEGILAARPWYTFASRTVIVAEGSTVSADEERPERLFGSLWVYRRPPIGSRCRGWIKEHRDFYSPQLENRRTVLVYLPPSYYDEPTKRYPVLYLQDGNNVFDTGTAFMGVAWNIEYAIERLAAASAIRECMAVGVFNTMGRMAEYTPSWDRRFEGGQAERYAEFLASTVKPFVDRVYRTLPGPTDTAVMGSSLGGLVSFWIGWHYPRVFSMVGAVSTSVWWDARSILRDVDGAPPGTQGLRIWLDVGTYEGGSDRDGDGVTDMVSDSRDLRDRLLDRGFRLHRDLEYFEDAGAGHNEAAWRDRVERPLLFFFGTKTAGSEDRGA